MQLTYFVDPHGNFGDDLNTWIWDRAAPGLIDDDPRSRLIGIGTLLGEWFTQKLPATAHKVVIGTGAGEKGKVPTIGPDWTVYGVRGPLSAAYLGLGPDKILADPAILIHEFTDLYGSANRDGVGFMPHIWTTSQWDWQAICARLGLVYIDPHADAFETVRRIGGLRRLVTEAMHGAIVADAIRVPWVAARVSTRFQAAKWCDWGSALGVDVKFHHVQQLRRRAPTHGMATVKAVTKQLAWTLGVSSRTPPRPQSSRYDVHAAEQALRFLAADAPEQLSADAALTAGIGRLRNALDRALTDKAAGKFG